MNDIHAMTSAVPTEDEELEDLEATDADAEQVKGGAGDDSDPDRGSRG